MWVAGMSSVSRSDGSTRSVDTKMAQHVAKAAGERKHGTVSSKRREVQKAKLGIASLHSSLNLECFRTVGGPFGTWFCALSGLGWGAFARFRWGAFRSSQGKKKKQQAINAKQACVHSLFVWLVSRTQEGCMPYRNEACNQV